MTWYSHKVPYVSKSQATLWYFWWSIVWCFISLRVQASDLRLWNISCGEYHFKTASNIFYCFSLATVIQKDVIAAWVALRNAVWKHTFLVRQKWELVFENTKKGKQAILHCYKNHTLRCLRYKQGGCQKKLLNCIKLVLYFLNENSLIMRVLCGIIERQNAISYGAFIIYVYTPLSSFIPNTGLSWLA